MSCARVGLNEERSALKFRRTNEWTASHAPNVSKHTLESSVYQEATVTCNAVILVRSQSLLEVCCGEFGCFTCFAAETAARGTLRTNPGTFINVSFPIKTTVFEPRTVETKSQLVRSRAGKAWEDQE